MATLTDMQVDPVLGRERYRQGFGCGQFGGAAYGEGFSTTSTSDTPLRPFEARQGGTDVRDGVEILTDCGPEPRAMKAEKSATAIFMRFKKRLMPLYMNAPERPASRPRKP